MQSYLAVPLPSWSPPPWVFGLVWTVRYVLIAFAGWRFRTAAGPIDRARPELSIHATGLILNELCAPLFFVLVHAAQVHLLSTRDPDVRAVARLPDM